MSEILIVYYSRSGSTEKRASAVAEGVRDGGGNPTLKKFFDESVVVRKKLFNKVGAAFATGAHRTGGKETALISILQAMLISGLVVVGDPFETGGHYGAAGSDDVGLKEGRALGKRVAELAELIGRK